jgi:hypothetical protein
MDVESGINLELTHHQLDVLTIIEVEFGDVVIQEDPDVLTVFKEIGGVFITYDVVEQVLFVHTLDIPIVIASLLE